VITGVVDKLDKEGFIMYRLFRDSTTYKRGTYIKVRSLTCVAEKLTAAGFEPLEPTAGARDCD